MGWIAMGVTLLVGICVVGIWYLRGHCINCGSSTAVGKLPHYCAGCESAFAAEVAAHRAAFVGMMTAASIEAWQQGEADEEEFGLSSGGFLDDICPLCAEGEQKTHRQIMRERGLSGNHKECMRFVFAHGDLVKAEHRKRESWKFWKRWLYMPPTPQEAEEIGRMARQLMVILVDDPRAREFRAYKEKPDHWVNMTTLELLKRRMAHAARRLGLSA